MDQSNSINVLDAKVPQVPHNKKHYNLPAFVGNKNNYSTEYQKMKWACDTCSKTYTISNKYKHLKSNYHLKREKAKNVTV